MSTEEIREELEKAEDFRDSLEQLLEEGKIKMEVDENSEIRLYPTTGA